MQQESGTRRFPAKLLLFGEYTVLDGGQALSVPLPQYSAVLEMDRENAAEQTLHWRRFHAFLSKLDKSLFPNAGKALSQMHRDIEQGLFFDSNITIGYGLGSSGALVAAVYQGYFVDDRVPLSALRERLATMEAFFHGSSSGLDPLVSFTGKPIIKSGIEYRPLEHVPLKEMPFSIFLVDSLGSRSTEKLVMAYRQLKATPAFREQCGRPLGSASDHAIHWFLLGQWSPFWENLALISQLQDHYMQPMIHPKIRLAWRETLSNSNIKMKLCGAGGGGYYLAFARKEHQGVELFFHQFGLEATHLRF